MKKVLLALDLEGVNNVTGEPYKGLSNGSEQLEIAIHQAALEINAAAKALFEAGVEKVDLWDNHGSGKNIIPEELDERIGIIDCDVTQKRMYFAAEYDRICYFGYHAMEGTLGGVLAHTMNSASVQYYKLNGRYIGEIDMDSYIASSHGTVSCFFAGGDIACEQAKMAVPGIITVVTKKEISRNEAKFRDNQALFADIKQKIVEAVEAPIPLQSITFPAKMEKSFKRTEDAAKYLSKQLTLGINAEYLNDEILGKDAHTVVSHICNLDEFIKSI